MLSLVDEWNTLKLQVGLIGGLSLVVGSMIGSGIFLSPSGILAQVNSVGASLCIWAGCGILATLCRIKNFYNIKRIWKHSRIFFVHSNLNSVIFSLKCVKNRCSTSKTKSETWSRFINFWGQTIFRWFELFEAKRFIYFSML